MRNIKKKKSVFKKENRQNKATNEQKVTYCTIQ